MGVYYDYLRLLAKPQHVSVVSRSCFVITAAASIDIHAEAWLSVSLSGLVEEEGSPVSLEGEGATILIDLPSQLPADARSERCPDEPVATVLFVVFLI